MAMNMDALLRIRADVDGQNKIVALNRGLNTVERNAKSLTGAMRGLTGASAGLSGALGTLTPLLSVVGLTGMVKGTIEAGSKMYDLAQATGVSVEALARFNKAAAVSGTDLDGVSKGLVKLSKTMFEAATGGKAASETFAALGISVRDANGKIKTSDRVMLEIANRFKAMADGPEKTALALRLFGRSGAELVPLLNMGGDAIDKLSTKMNAAFAQKADEYDDKLKMLGGKVRALGMDLTIALLPALNQITDALTAVISGFSKLPAPIQSAAVATAALALAWGPLAGLFSAGTGAVKFLANGMEILRYQTALAGGVMPLLAGGLQSVRVAILAIPGWGWAIAGVTALAALTKVLYDNNETFRAWAQNIGGVVANDFKAAMKSIANDAQAAATNVAKYFESFGGYLSGLGGWIQELFRGAFGSVAQSSQQAALQARNGWADAWSAMVNNATAAFNGLGKLISSWWNRIPAPIRGFMSGQAKSTGVGMGLGTAEWIINASKRAVAKGSQTVNSQGKGGLPNMAPLPSFTPDLGALSGAGGGGGKTKKGADEAKKALDQYNSAVKSGSDVTRTLMERLQDVNLNMIGIGANATDALGLQRLKTELTNARDYGEEMRKIADLENQRNEAAAKGISTKDLDARIAAAKELALALKDARSQEASDVYTQGLMDLLPKEAEYNRQIKEAALLLENKKKGIEGLTEVQKLNLQIELLDLEAKAVGNEALAEQIRLLRERAAALDAANAKGDKTFGESFKDKVKGYTDSVKDLGAAFGNIAVNSLQKLEDTLFEFVTTGKLKFKEFVASVLSDLAKLAIKLAIVNTIKAIFPGAGFALGGVMSKDGPMPLKTYARGGIANSPQLAMFGEGSKPEAYVPLPDGRRIPVAMQGGGGGNTTVNVSVDAKGTSVQGNSGQSEQLGRAISQAVQAELVKQKRPGGLLAA